MNSKQRRRRHRKIRTRSSATENRRHAGALELRSEGGEIRAALSSEAPVKRSFGLEVLDHGAINLTRAARGLPLIMQHDHDGPLPIGRVVDIAVDADRKLRGTFKFSQRAEAQAIRQDVLDGIVTDVSLGYAIDRDQVTRRGDTFIFRNWTPYEASLVSIPADDSVGINRGSPTMFDQAKIEALFKAHLSRRGVPELLKRIIDAKEMSTDEAQRALLDHLGTLEPDTGDPDDVGAEGNELAIRRAFDRFMDREGVPKLMRAMLEGKKSPDEAQRALLDHLGTIGNAKPGTATTPEPGDDAGDKFARAAEQAILVRANVATKEEREQIGSNPFTSYSLVELARAYCDVQRIDYRGLSAGALIGRAIDPGTATYETTDFAAILENVMNKALFRGFEQAEVTWDQWCSVGQEKDFKPYTRPGISQLSSLELVAENAEIQDGTLIDKKEGAQIGTYATKISLTREAIINDDLSAFSDLGMKGGAAANRTIDEIVYGLLTSQSGAGPDMTEDSNPLFDAANHGNYVTAGAPPTEDLINAGKVAMAAQVDQNSVILGIRPRYALSGIALEDTFIKLATAEYSPNATAGTLTPNTVRNTFVPIASARLAAAPWYLAGPMGTTCEVTFLNGQRSPSMEREQGWSTFAMHWRIWIDFAALFLDWRAMYQNDGVT